MHGGGPDNCGNDCDPLGRMPSKENIRVDGERDIQTKVMTTLFVLFAEVERDLISERTREGLARARSSGRKLGRPKGSLGVSRLDGKEDAIRHFLELGVSKTAGVSRTALYSFHEHPRAQAEPLSVYFNTNVVGTLLRAVPGARTEAPAAAEHGGAAKPTPSRRYRASHHPRNWPSRTPSRRLAGTRGVRAPPPATGCRLLHLASQHERQPNRHRLSANTELLGQ